MILDERELSIADVESLQSSSGGNGRGTAGGGMLTTPIMPQLIFFRWQDEASLNNGQLLLRDRRSQWGHRG